MKVQTTYKAGEASFTTVKNSLQNAGQKASEALGNAVSTISKPSFWTWPF